MSSSSISKDYISSCQKQFSYYKDLADKSIASLSDDQLFSCSYSKIEGNELNSAAVIVKHVAGNMISRWTDFYSSDGEKEWRDRDREFQINSLDRSQLLAYWEEGWKCLFSVIDALDEEKLGRTIFIRNMGHKVVEAINRQLMHYAYHVGQIVSIAKQWQPNEWESLSIPLHTSAGYNKSKFDKGKRNIHFTDDL